MQRLEESSQVPKDWARCQSTTIITQVCQSNDVVYYVKRGEDGAVGWVNNMQDFPTGDRGLSPEWPDHLIQLLPYPVVSVPKLNQTVFSTTSMHDCCHDNRSIRQTCHRPRGIFSVIRTCQKTYNASLFDTVGWECVGCGLGVWLGAGDQRSCRTVIILWFKSGWYWMKLSLPKKENQHHQCP